MKRTYRNIIRGAGSILDIMPSSPGYYSRYIPAGTPRERIQKTWQRVGLSIHKAMGEFEREQKAHRK